LRSPFDFVFVENAVFRCGPSREKTPPAKPAGFAGVQTKNNFFL